MKKEIFNLKAYRFKLQRPKFLQVITIRNVEHKMFPKYLPFTTGEICRCLHILKERGFVILANSVVVNNTNFPGNIPYYEGFVRAFKRPKNKNFPKGICFDALPLYKNKKSKGFFNPIMLSHSKNNFLDKELISNFYGDKYIIDGERALDYTAKPIQTNDFIKIEFNIMSIIQQKN